MLGIYHIRLEFRVLWFLVLNFQGHLRLLIIPENLTCLVYLTLSAGKFWFISALPQ